MKKIILTFIGLVLLMSSGCIPDQADNEQEESAANYIKSNLEKETSPQVDHPLFDQLNEGNLNFALDFYDQINQGEDNLIFSPLSISIALSMTLAGAESSTEQAMLEALRLSLPEEEVYPVINALMLSIEESQQALSEDVEGSQFQLNIANSIWGQTGYTFKEPFLDTIARYYGTGMYLVNFREQPEAARIAINEWVEEETKDKIQDLIPSGAINTLTRLVLANAIYFNGSWFYPFNESETSEAPFYLRDDTETPVDMMRLSGESLSYIKGENYQAVNLPYLSSDFAMTMILPDPGNFNDFEENFNSDILSSLVNTMQMAPVNLQMPKFDFTTETDAKLPLTNMGMAEAFDMDLADLSGITDEEELYISDVLHKATISVDEKGTEAAAATAVIIAAKSAPMSEPINLVIDRPFMFFIRHLPTGTILFMGRVTQP